MQDVRFARGTGVVEPPREHSGLLDWLGGLVVVAAGLLLFDGLWFVESRLGMSNILYAVLANAALFAFARALAAPAPATPRRRPRPRTAFSQ